MAKKCDDILQDISLHRRIVGASQHGILSRNPMGCDDIRDGACAITSGLVSLALLSSLRFPLKSIIELCPGQVRRFFTWIRTHTMEDPKLLSASKRHRSGWCHCKKVSLEVEVIVYGSSSFVNAEPGREPFEDVSIYSPSDASEDGRKLAFSRAYTLSLSPQLVYTRSKLLPTLVSSRVYRQLEFQAVGSWWIYVNSANSDDDASGLRRVPSSREDIFADDTISMKAKRMLIRFLRNVNQPQQTDESSETPTTEEENNLVLSEYLNTKFNAPSELHNPIHSLSLCQQAPHKTPSNLALPRIKRHLGSLGVFGPGFGSLVAKWGGGAEIAQVGCRALAVGGGVYVLGRGVKSVDPSKDNEGFHNITLSDGEKIRSKSVAGTLWDLPNDADSPLISTQKVSRSISIVSSPLKRLFPVTAEGGPVPAGAVAFVPGEVLADDASEVTPVYLILHSSETGECPDGQCKLTSISSFTSFKSELFNDDRLNLSTLPDGH